MRNKLKRVKVRQRSRIKKQVGRANHMDPIRSIMKKCMRKYFSLRRIGYGSEDYRRPVIFLNSPEKFKRYDNFFETYFVGKNVVDIGCANGFFSIWISMYANSVIGVDINKNNIKWNMVMKEASGRENVNFLTFDIKNISKKFLSKYQIDSVFWHNTSFDGMKELWDFILTRGEIKTVITNFPSHFDDQYLREELKYEHIKSSIGKIHVINKS